VGRIIDHYLSLLRTDGLNVLTIHAELEGMKQMPLFRSLLERLRTSGVQVVKLDDHVRGLLKDPSVIPVCGLIQGSVDGRSGTLAVPSCT
jgi:undecaprenyl phosphate-alpha-L-ara4FN deformylase